MQQLGDQMKQSLDKIAAAKNDPNGIERAVTEAKQKIDQAVQQASQQQGGAAQQQGQPSRGGQSGHEQSSQQRR